MSCGSWKSGRRSTLNSVSAVNCGQRLITTTVKLYPLFPNIFTHSSATSEAIYTRTYTKRTAVVAVSSLPKSTYTPNVHTLTSVGMALSKNTLSAATTKLFQSTPSSKPRTAWMRSQKASSQVLHLTTSMPVSSSRSNLAC